MSLLFRVLMVIFGVLALGFAVWKLLPKTAHEQIQTWVQDIFPAPEQGEDNQPEDDDSGDTGSRANQPSAEELAELALRNWRKQPKVILDPGHGGSDVGRYQGREGRSEKELVLDLSLRIARILREREIPVELTRSEDVFLSLDERVEFSRLHPQGLFVSIHMNAHTSSAPHGVETFWFSRQASDLPEGERNTLRRRSRRMAQLVHRELMLQLPEARDRTMKSENYQVVREPHIPSILVESGFLSNPAEAKKLRDVNYRETIALGIANGIEKAWQEELMLWPERVEPAS